MHYSGGEGAGYAARQPLLTQGLLDKKAGGGEAGKQQNVLSWMAGEGMATGDEEESGDYPQVGGAGLAWLVLLPAMQCWGRSELAQPAWRAGGLNSHAPARQAAMFCGCDSSHKPSKANSCLRVLCCTHQELDTQRGLAKQGSGALPDGLPAAALDGRDDDAASAASGGDDASSIASSAAGVGGIQVRWVQLLTR